MNSLGRERAGTSLFHHVQWAMLAALLVAGVTATAPAVRAQAQPSAEGGKVANASTAPSAAEPRHEFENDEDGGKLFERMEWFYGPREYPLNHLPPRARYNAFQQKAAKEALEASGRRRPGAPSISEPAWTLIGPQPITENGIGNATGRVTALAIDPTNTQTIFAGGAEGGIWKTTNGGTTWTPMTDTQMSLATGSIAIDPENHDTIYVGTGEENFSVDSYYGVGILKSIDGGSTWTLNSGPFGFNDQCSLASVGAIAVEPNNSDVVVAATSCGVFQSTDAGITWVSTLNGAGNDGVSATSAVFDPSNPSTVYAGVGYIFGGSGPAPGVYKSTNGGATWALMNGTGATTLPAGGRVTLALAASSSSTLFASITDPSNLGNLLGLYKTTDGANTWTQLVNTPDYCTPQCWYDAAIAVSPTNPNVIFAGGGGPTPIVASLDGGTTWTNQYNNEVHVDAHAFAFTPDGSTLLFGCDGGVWSTTNPTGATVSWTSLNNTFAMAEFYPGLSIASGNVNITVAGTQDNYTEEYTGSLAWNPIACGDGGATAIDFVNNDNIYTNCIQLSLYKSTDGGVTFNNMINGINTGDPISWIPPLAMDPENSETLYFGTNHVYQTIDGAGLWTEISPDLTQGTGNDLSALAVAPSNSNTVYSGSNDAALYVTNNATSGASATWTNIGDPTFTKLPNRVITAIAVDPAHPGTAYYTYSGFTNPMYGDNLGHVFMTSNGGTSWTDISGDLPNTPVDSIVLDHNSPSATFYIGTDVGAFYTTTAGASWSTLGAGLPNVVVTGLALYTVSPSDVILRAATHGRSMWDLNVASIPLVPSLGALSPSSALAGGAQFTLTVTGQDFDSQAVVQWNGVDLATTFVSATEVMATVSASDIAAAGTVNVTVQNADSGATSNASIFTVDNPVPTETTLSPSSALVGGGQFTLTVNGTNFVSTSVVQWNGAALSTTFVTSGQLTATVPASGLMTAGNVQVTVMNPAPGGGTSGALTFSIDNPAPTATTLSPSSALAGSAQFTLTVNGTNFVASSSVQWNGSGLATTFVSGTQLTAVVPASDVANAGTAQVTVMNPAPGGGTSNALTFTVDNPVPTATSLMPSSANAGGAAFTLTVNGTNFVSTSVVEWNGSARTTTFVNSRKVTAAINAADIASAGTVSVTVMNPAPGGGTSGTLTFTVKNLVPTETSLSPTSAIAGGAAFTLTVTGTNFVSTSVVQWNSSARATTFVSSTMLKGSITAADIAVAGTASVTVMNPGPGGGTSHAQTFTIDNPVPTETSLSPSSGIAGGPQFTMTVTGTNFVQGSLVKWKGTSLTTTFVSSTSLKATVPGSDIATAGTATVTVFNGTPGGGTSAALTFTINNPVPTETLLTPSSATAGGAAFTLKVTGTNFVSTSTVQWKGQNRTTTFVSSTVLNAAILATDITSAGTVSVTVVNKAPGGGTSNALTFTINNPAPHITSISPTSALAGSAAFTLTVNGTGFVSGGASGSAVDWNGTALANTHYVNGTQLTVTVPAADIANAGTAQVTVVNPAPGGGTSNAVTFDINNPVPNLTSLMPSSKTHGGAAFTLTVHGTGFVSASQAEWNGSNRTTTFVNSTEIQAAILASDISTAGTAQVTASNPAPGGGTSNALTFTIN